MKTVMEKNGLLEMCGCIYNIMNYLDAKGVISISADCGKCKGKVHLNSKVFREIFPDVEPDEDGYAIADYNGLKVVAIFSGVIEP